MKSPNTITKSVAAAVAATSLSVAAFAGTTVQTAPVAPAPSFYNAQELSLGASALYGVRSSSNGGDKGTWGADVDLAYFITRNFGVSLEQQWYDFGRPLWNTSGNLIWRFPINDGPLAPYLMGGVGAVYASKKGFFEGHLGAGLEYRFTPKLGAFIDGRYNWLNGNEDRVPEYGAFRAGLRFVF